MLGRKRMEIEVLRIGQRVVRDDRVTTHVALVARSFGAKKIYMNEINPEINDTVSKINKTWGGDFKIEMIDDWKKIIREKKNMGTKIVHLTMYGQPYRQASPKIRRDRPLLIVVGGAKVPAEVFKACQYNIGVGNQPHSEVAALALFMDEWFGGGAVERSFPKAQLVIEGSNQGKIVHDLGREEE